MREVFESPMLELMAKRDLIEKTQSRLFSIYRNLEDPEFKGVNIPDLKTTNPNDFLTNYSRIGIIKENIMGRTIPRLGMEFTRVGQQLMDLETQLHEELQPKVKPSAPPTVPVFAAPALPVEPISEHEIEGEKHQIALLNDIVINRLSGATRELAEVANGVLMSESADSSFDQREEILIKSMYGYELDAGLMTYLEARTELFEVRKSLNKKLESYGVKLNDQNNFEGDLEGKEYLTEIGSLEEEEAIIIEEEPTAIVLIPTAEPTPAPEPLGIPEPVGPSKKEMVRRERFTAALEKIQVITESLTADDSKFYDGIDMQVFRNLAKATFGRNLDDKIIYKIMQSKIIRPQLQPGKSAPILTLEEQASLVYVVLYDMNFIHNDGKDFIMNVATESLKEWREKGQSKGDKNGYRR